MAKKIVEMKPVEAKSLSRETEIKLSSGDTLVIDFSDARIVNKLLKLIKYYSNLETELSERAQGIDSIEDELDKLIATSDLEIELLEKLRDDFNGVFNTDITSKLFGKTLPQADRYLEVFELITPYIMAYKLKEQETAKLLNEKYSLSRITPATIARVNNGK